MRFFMETFQILEIKLSYDRQDNKQVGFVLENGASYIISVFAL